MELGIDFERGARFADPETGEPEDATKEPNLEGALEKENLRAVWLAVKAKGGAPGVDGMDIR